MSEVQRFIRYVFPGLAVLLQVAAAVTVSSDAKALAGMVQAIGSPTGALTTVLASGGLGYVLANVYFALYWRLSSPMTLDHRPLLMDIRESVVFKRLSGHDVDIDINRLTKREAWTIVVGFWHSRHRKRVIKGNRPFVDRLVDNVASLGATIVGSAFAFLMHVLYSTSSLLCQGKGAPIDLGVVTVIVLWAILILCFCLAHQLANQALQRIVNTAIAQVVTQAKEVGKVPVAFWVDLPCSRFTKATESSSEW
jgi:hypothetical protein